MLIETFQYAKNWPHLQFALFEISIHSFKKKKFLICFCVLANVTSEHVQGSEHQDNFWEPVLTFYLIETRMLYFRLIGLKPPADSPAYP